MTMPAPPQPTLMATLSTDAADAAWRTAGSQLLKLVREPAVALLCRHLGPDDESFRARVAAFLETEVGGAILCAMISAGLLALPAVGPQTALVTRLSRELRVKAMSSSGDALADVLMGPLRQVIVLYLQGQPETGFPPQLLGVAPGREFAAQTVFTPAQPAPIEVDRVQAVMAALGCDEAKARSLVADAPAR